MTTFYGNAMHGGVRFPWHAPPAAEGPDEDDFLAPSTHDQVRPTTWDDWVGQPHIKRRLQVEIQASQRAGRRLDHVFLTGPGGSGKTTLAALIGIEIGCPVIEVTRPASESELARRLWREDVDDRAQAVLFLDEIHRWTRAERDGLLTLLEQQFIDSKFGRFTFAGVTVVAATTDRQAILPTVRDRFPINLTFDGYTVADLAEIVDSMATRVGVELDTDTVNALAVACRGVPRIARNLVVAGRSLAEVHCEPTATAIFDLTCTHEDGLTDDHIRYLEVLADSDGVAGLDVLTTRLMVSKKEVMDLERPLLDFKYIGLAPRGRLLTAVGRRRLEAGQRRIADARLRLETSQ